ncbi:MAG: hypothetical protein F6K24_46645 [Okeania sp. SIO2D1]|nr:hypothetical protein [Okeania sp. SIO2D1]
MWLATIEFDSAIFSVLLYHNYSWKERINQESGGKSWRSPILLREN